MTDLDITDGVMAELRSAADIVQIIGEHTRLKKAGRSWKGLCPIHNERTPSFTSRPMRLSSEATAAISARSFSISCSRDRSRA